MSASGYCTAQHRIFTGRLQGLGQAGNACGHADLSVPASKPASRPAANLIQQVERVAQQYGIRIRK
jgi:hypothetical protein